MTHNNPQPSRYQSRPFEMVLDFCVELSRRMIMSGANVERVNLAVDRVLSTYELNDSSIFILPTYVSVSAKDQSGYSSVRQAEVPAGGINLTRLMSLNRLSYTVKEQHPSPDRLGALLEKASDTKDYSDFVVLLGQICAMSCLSLLFGGGLREIICVAAVTVLAHYLLVLLAIPGVDKILTNALLMWIATTVVFLLAAAGITDKQPVVIVTALMLVIPGIPLTNAVRSILCGNELSGGMQTMRVTVETMALATGIFLSMVMFSSEDLLNNPVGGTITNPFILILLAFGTSFFLGVVFRILPRDLWLAAPLRKTCLRYSRGVCGLYLRGIARQTAKKAIHLLHLPGDHSADPRRSLLLHADRDQPEKQRNGEDQRIRLRADAGFHERRFRSQFRHSALRSQSEKQVIPLQGL